MQTDQIILASVGSLGIAGIALFLSFFQGLLFLKRPSLPWNGGGAADERKLKQILYNLLANAVKFSPDRGTVKLSARPLSFRQNRWVMRGADAPGLPFVPPEEGKWVAVEIQDSGIGQNETDLKRIFTPFEQADHSAGRRFQGTGLGLSLTRRLVELHGERVWGASEGAGKINKFSFVIPVDPRPGNGKEW